MNMKKIAVSGLLAASLITPAFAVLANDSTTTPTSASSTVSVSGGQIMKDAEMKVRALMLEMEAKIKAIRADYKAQINALRKDAKARAEAARSKEKSDKEARLLKMKGLRDQVKQTLKTERENIKDLRGKRATTTAATSTSAQ